MEDLTGKQFGHYQIVSPLGEGGMAAVYKAYQPSMERYVAIKVLPRHMAGSEEFVARFKREAKLLAQLQHPHILPVFDYGESDGYPYIVMPFVQSGTLSDIIRTRQLSLGDVRRIMTQLGQALQYAHARGMIHRDIKPSNVLIDESNNCLLTDFGLARMTEDAAKLTSSGAIMGTPAYMSPEQGRGDEVDARSDIYALGVILYEMVTGRVPYSAETPIAIVFKHIQDPLPPARTLNPNVPEAVELVLFKALAKNPADRYQTAEEFAAALQRAIPENGEAIGAVITPETVSAPTEYNQPAAEPTRAAIPAQASELPPPAAPSTPAAPSATPTKAARRLPWIWIAVSALLVFCVVAGGVRLLLRQKGSALPVQPVETRTITLWHDWSPEQVAAVRNILNDYEAAHPGITIVLSEAPNDKELSTAIAEGSGPDILIQPNNNIGSLAQSGSIVDLESLGVERAFMEKTYAPVAINGVSWNNKTWGFPINQEAIALIYNKAIASKEDFPAIPNNFINLLERSKAFAKANPGKYLVCNPGLGNADAYHVAPIFFGFGVKGYISPQDRPNLDTPSALVAARWLVEFKPYTFANAQYNNCLNFLVKGQTAAFWTGPWAIPELKARGVDVGVIPMGSPFVGIRTFMVTSNAIQRGNQAAVVDILTFLTNTENTLRIIQSVPFIPANQKALESPLLKDNPILEGFIKAAANGVPLSPSPIANAQWEPVAKMIGIIWNNQLPPKEALAQAQAEMEAAIAKLKP